MIGYVVLAMLAIIEWRLRGDRVPLISDSRAGMIQVVLMVLAGLFGMLGLHLDVEGLLILNTPLQVIGLAIFLWRLRAELSPGRWNESTVGLMLRTAMIGLVGLLC